MFKKVLVPLDGSALSEEALPVAQRLLDGGADEATLFIAADAPQPTRRRRAGLQQPVSIAMAAAGPMLGQDVPATPPSNAENNSQAVERREHELLEYLAKAGRGLVQTGRLVSAAVHFGDPAKEIISFAKRGGFDVIVMATHGRSGLRETLQGSVTSEVLRSGVAPVLVIRPKKRRTRRKP
ncbi:MAG: universal stress protein [Dehalococcoidia bacterium]|nr:universal stress protein [Dehalococcoidia bacterium]